jgi:hypothetical protein
LASFAFVRVIRPVPKLRGIRPLQRSGGPSVGCSLPTEQALSSEPRVAILDGGVPKHHPIGPGCARIASSTKTPTMTRTARSTALA